MKSIYLRAAFAAALVATPFVAHADVAADRCGGAKAKAVAKYAAAVFQCHAAAIRSGASVDPDCLSAAGDAAASAFAAAESAGGCVTSGDEPSAANIADTAASDVDTLLTPDAADAARQCAYAKLRSAAHHVQSRLACYAKTARRSLPPRDDCFARSRNRFDSGFSDAEAAGGCTTTGDADAVAHVDEQAVEDLVRALSPVCGDGIAGPTQQCERGDDAVCPTLCSRACVCVPPPVCGDGVAQLPEECDDGNTNDGDGCSAQCELESASALCTGITPVAGTGINAVLISNDFVAPTFVTAPRLDPSRLFVTERAGYVRIVRLVDNTVEPTPFLDIHDLTTTGGEHGLFSMAFDPAYEQNGRFYVAHSNPAGDLVVARYEVDAMNPDVADASTRTELLVIPHPGSSNHYAGQIQFGSDGDLYLSEGDGGDSASARDDGSMLGKILRLDVTHDAPPYATVPPTNPHYVDGTSDLEYVWAKGLRNPWRFSFDRASGDLYIGDVGFNRVEEIDYAPVTSTGGEDYGWNAFEGSECFRGPCPDPAVTMPVYEYPHGRPCAVMGGYVYRGCAMPDLAGTYFFSDLCAAFVHTFEMVGGVATNFTDRTRDAKSEGAYFTGVISWGEDARGELYLVNGNNSIYRIEPE